MRAALTTANAAPPRVFAQSVVLASMYNKMVVVLSVYLPAVNAPPLISACVKHAVLGNTFLKPSASLVQRTASNVTPQAIALPAGRASSCKMGSALKNVNVLVYSVSSLKVSSIVPNVWEAITPIITNVSQTIIVIIITLVKAAPLEVLWLKVFVKLVTPMIVEHVLLKTCVNVSPVIEGFS